MRATSAAVYTTGVVTESGGAGPVAADGAQDELVREGARRLAVQELASGRDRLRLDRALGAVFGDPFARALALDRAVDGDVGHVHAGGAPFARGHLDERA